LKAMKRIANHEEMQRNKKIRRNIKEIEEAGAGGGGGEEGQGRLGQGHCTERIGRG